MSDVTEIICVIDRSGSMEPIQGDAIGGFNAFLTAQKELAGEAKLTLVLFDQEYEVVHDGAPVVSVAPLDERTYVPRGMTALFDAVGRAIMTVDARLAKTVDQPRTVIACILTDGEENSSREYTRTQIFDLIREHKAKGWEFLFLAANQDAFSAAEKMAIDRKSAVSFEASGRGITGAFSSATNIVTGLRGTSKKHSDDDGSGGGLH